jgi:hypothetical protein
MGGCLRFTPAATCFGFGFGLGLGLGFGFGFGLLSTFLALSAFFGIINLKKSPCIA